MIRRDKNICGGKPRIAGVNVTIGFLLNAYINGCNNRIIIEWLKKNRKVTITQKDIAEALIYVDKRTNK